MRKNLYIMQVVITTEQRFFSYGNQVFAQAEGSYEFWQRYLKVFSSAVIVARVHKVSTLPEGSLPVTGPDVTCGVLGAYVGPWQGVLALPTLLKHTKKLAGRKGAFILRVPGAIGTLMARHLNQQQCPYALEVKGNPYDSLSPLALSRIWGYFMRPLAVYSLRAECKRAVSVAYVTKNTLQKHYPAGGKSFACSDVELPDELFAAGPIWDILRSSQRSSRYKLIFIGSLSQRYKGLHVLLTAIRQCIDAGVDIDLEILGDGEYRQEYVALSRELGLDAYVSFRGCVTPGTPVFESLRFSDLFVMPSLVEGLPRAMIEAMACGLPCIGSKVGGIPELLPETDMFPANDPFALAQKIMEVLNDPQRMSTMGQRNFRIAMAFRSDLLQEKRHQFYQYVHDVTLEHMQQYRQPL
jgi:glycosyltransferase involved in cell wall biosynthesis